MPARPGAIMQYFFFVRHTLFARTAQRLQNILPRYAREAIPDSFNWKFATAVTFGHEDLHAYNRAVKLYKHLPPPRDEELSRDQLNERRLAQAQRLTAFAERNGLRIENLDALIEDWQPSAERPRSTVFTQDELDSFWEQGIPSKALQALERFQTTGEVPSAEDLELIRKGLKSARNFQKAWIPLEIGSLAVSLVNTKHEPTASTGVELLQLLAEINFTFAKFQLAQVLTNSQSCEQNLARARSLCESVQKAYNAGEDVFVNPESHIDFLRLKARLWCESTLREDRLHAVRCLEEAVVKGSGLAALHLSHYYSEQPRNTPPDIYTGVDQPNTERAMHYFLLALQRGFNPSTQEFPKNAL